MGKSEKVILRCNKVLKIYKGGMQHTKALSGVSLSFNEASINLIYGKSGSGKSTLLNVLAGIDNASDGDIFFQGKNYAVMTEREMANHLIPHITAKENIMCPSYVNGKPIDAQYFSFLVQELGITDLVLKCPYELSGGEQQRVAIARAMLLKPSIVFADEPTGNLDSENTKLITNLFDNLNKKYGTTFIIVTHEENLMQNPDQIIRIKDGEVADE